MGPSRAELLARLNLHTVEDLLLHLPFRYEEQGPPQPIDQLQLDEQATVIVQVENVRWESGRGRRVGCALHARVRDPTGRLRVVWFNAPYLRERIHPGTVLRLFGRVEADDDRARMINPQVEILADGAVGEALRSPRIVPVYNATAGLTSAQLARIIDQARREVTGNLPEPLPAALLARYRWPGRAEALAMLHRPARLEDTAVARRRLAYEELFLMQLAILLYRRWRQVRARAPVLLNSPRIDQRIRLRFPFPPTAAQERVIARIVADLGRPRPMSRLLQGDVGSGKTVVALYAALVTVANRHQCAILAPTEVLASQHFTSIERYLAGSRVRRCLLTGRVPRAARERALQAIAAGEMDLIVGTQALLEREVRFAQLGLVIVDEQHKFGVGQRATIRGVGPKAPAGQPSAAVQPRPPSSPDRVPAGPSMTPADSRQVLEPHYLVMTATPIPRTLSMTVFGDLDVSIIDELPPGRQPIVTRLITPSAEPQAWAAVRRRIAEGDQVYIVYPLVEESDAMDLKAATTEAARVARELLPGARVGLLHGRLPKDQKLAVMTRFAGHELDVLVSTTVIEVGIDVPNATVMVIQHAERYGLAALHQLRGRVGRGRKPSVCLLFSDTRSPAALERLRILCRTTDGFRIAEEDLRLRGPGELLGTRQHGFPEMRVASLLDDGDLLVRAREDAAALIEADPRLAAPEHAVLRAELRRRFRDKVAFMEAG